MIARPFSNILEGRGNCVSFLRTLRKQMSLLSSRKARKRIWGTEGWLLSPWSQGKGWSK